MLKMRGLEIPVTGFLECESNPNQLQKDKHTTDMKKASALIVIYNSGPSSISFFRSNVFIFQMIGKFMKEIITNIRVNASCLFRCWWKYW